MCYDAYIYKARLARQARGASSPAVQGVFILVATDEGEGEENTDLSDECMRHVI